MTYFHRIAHKFILVSFYIECVTVILLNYLFLKVFCRILRVFQLPHSLTHVGPHMWYPSVSTNHNLRHTIWILARVPISSFCFYILQSGIYFQRKFTNSITITIFSLDNFKLSAHVTKPLQTPILLSSCIFKIRTNVQCKKNTEKLKRDKYIYLATWILTIWHFWFNIGLYKAKIKISPAFKNLVD